MNNDDEWVEGHALGRSFEEARMTETLLGAAMRQTEIMDELLACGFGEDDLDHKLHRSIWRTAMALHATGAPTEPAIVEAKLIADGGDVEQVRQFIAGCMRGGVEVAHPRLAAFVQHVRNKVALRRLGQLGQRMVVESSVDNATPSVIASAATTEIERILMGAATADGADGNELARIIDDARNKRAGRMPVFHSLNHPVLDDLLHGGLQEGTVALVSAEISVGKSTIARSFARTFAKRGVPTLLFTFEMGRDEIALCLQQTESGVVMDDSTLSAREHAQVIEAANTVAKWPLYIEDRQLVTVEDVTTRVHQYVKRHGVRVVIVDYVQDIEFSTRFQREDMNFRHISKTLRRCVDGLGVLMIQMAQQKGDDKNAPKGTKKSADDVVADSRQFMKDAHVHIALKGFRLDERLKNLTMMTVTKNRRFGKLGAAYVTYDPRTGNLSPSDARGEPLTTMTQVEIDDPFLGDDR